MHGSRWEPTSPVCIHEANLSNVFVANCNLTHRAARVPDRDRVLGGEMASLLTLVALVSCGGRSDRELTSNAGGATNGGGDAAGTDGGGAAGAGVTNSTGIDGLGCRGVPIPQEEYDRAASAACAGVDVACGLSPVHLHLVLERSTRMNESIGGVSNGIWCGARSVCS